MAAVLRYFKMIYWLVMLFILSPLAYLGIMLPLYPLYFLRNSLYLRISKFMTKYHNKLMGVIAFSSGFEITDYGDDVVEFGRKKCLVMANHQSRVDHFPLMATFSTKSEANINPLWLIYKFLALRWSPLGISWALHGNYFVEIGNRDKEVIKLKRHLIDNYWKNDFGWIVLYPEGAILDTYKFKSQAFAAKHGYPHLERTLLPRTTAVKAILESNEENKTSTHSIDYIIDVTIAYPDNATPTMTEALQGMNPKRKTAIFYRIFKISDLTSLSEDDIRKWLFDRWVEKEKLLEFYHENNCFPGKGTKVEWETWKCIVLQCLWLLGFFFVTRLWLGIFI